ncbi:MAG: DUF58 domain-containing protein [Actinobacteria bacterium]|uniref:Unannotated protein n=1 Tax=freshwater metagenome TaxID=449393 RepID=A0A6J6J737_9ZZZZ|nr:DUF58 domain-containing protein [Actinomycetota bacterium]MSZ52662.1 DUF58 domain-containing protein [Actinomycetota bacterium]MTB22358.1 DUF58 domain-containing protein [Actinomycetota bacterium]
MSTKKTVAPSIDGTPAAEILRRLEITVTRRLDGLLQGDHRGLTPGHGSEPGEIRAYQPGDDVRRIDWNVTARLGETHVRDSVADRELETWILVDASASLAFGTATCEKRDLALAAAAATGFLTARTGNRIGAMTIGPDGASPPIPARSGRVHMQALLRRVLGALDNPQPGRTDLTAGLRRIAGTAKRRGLIVVISDFLDPGLWDTALRTLALRHDVLCIEVVDPVELELPDVGMLVLHDTVTGHEIEVPTGNAKFRDRYALAAAEQRAVIASRIRTTSADHLVLRTDRDWLLDLARFVSRRRDRIDSQSRSAAHGSGNVGAIAGATLTTGAVR